MKELYYYIIIVIYLLCIKYFLVLCYLTYIFGVCIYYVILCHLNLLFTGMVQYKFPKEKKRLRIIKYPWVKGETETNTFYFKHLSKEILLVCDLIYK